MTVGERIKKARKNAGMTQKQLAEILNFSYVNISQLENNQRTPGLETLKRIAAALDVPVPELMGLEQIDKYTWGHEAGPDRKRDLEENYRRHHGGQARANAAMDQMDEEGKSRVADYAEDILPRYRRQDAPEPPHCPVETTGTAAPPEGTGGPTEKEIDL